MEEMYRTVTKIAISNEVKEKLNQNRENTIRKEQDKRILECEKILNNNSKLLVDKFYKITNKMWIKILNKKLFYVDGEIVDENRKNLKLLISKEDSNSDNSRYLTENEAKFIFYEKKSQSPIIERDTVNHRNWIKIQNNKRFDIRDAEIRSDINAALDIYVIDIKKVPNRLEIFFKNDLVPKGFSNTEKDLYKIYLELYIDGYLSVDESGKSFKLTDKFVKKVYDGDYTELAGVSFLRSDIEKFLFKDDTKVQLTGDIEQIVFSDYLDCDFKRAGIDKYDKKLLEDAERGHWDLWDYNGKVNEENVIKLAKPLVARNPIADIHWDGVVGIDFGTKSTVVVYQDGDAHMYPMRVGSGNYRKEVRVTDYENPTVMQFINLERFMEMYKAKEGRPDTLWEDVNISHTAAEALKTASSEKFYSFFSDLKQWCGDKNRQVRIRDTKGIERTLPAFTEMEEGGFDPIELYAYFLGLFINNMHRGIFLDYILSFPVTYEKAVRDKILKSFRDGLWKSLPVQVHNDEEVLKKFRVAQGASEPAAYAACALKEYGFNPGEGEKVLYGIFDFGGGTTDFDFGLWRTPENDRERRRYDYVIEHFGASGDQYLGGENLLELLAFSIFKNNHSKLREADISFTRPHGCENFPGSESLVKESQEAKLNTKQLMETVRGLWEHNNPEQIKNIESGAVKVNLFSNKGERVQNFELKTDKTELDGILRDRIKEGVDNFFNALKLNFARNDVAECDCVNIFLAGNSSKSPVVWQLFEEQIKERTDDLNKKRADKGEETDAGHLYYKIFPPLGVTEEDIKGQAGSAVKVEGAVKKADGNSAGVKKSNPSKNTLELKPTGKTGVAYGLLLCRKGGKIKDVPEKKQDEEAKFKYYLGCEVKGKFNTIVNTSIKYGQWVLFIDASVDEFDIYYTSSPNCTTNQLDIDAGSVFLKKCSIKEENDEADIYIRTVAPTVVEYVVATEEGIKQQEYIEEPVKVELG